MTSKAETVACRWLRVALAGLDEGASIPDSEEFRKFLSALEWVLPEYLAEVYDFWRGAECLDGVYPEVARKIGSRAVEIIGLGIFISDQTLTPLHVCLQIQERSGAIPQSCQLRVSQENR